MQEKNPPENHEQTTVNNTASFYVHIWQWDSPTKKQPGKPLSSAFPAHIRARSSSTQMTYTESVIQAGGTPILISITTDSLVLTDIANRLDGIILIGGGDIPLPIQ